MKKEKRYWSRVKQTEARKRILTEPTPKKTSAREKRLEQLKGY